MSFRSIALCCFILASSGCGNQPVPGQDGAATVEAGPAAATNVPAAPNGVPEVVMQEGPAAAGQGAPAAIDGVPVVPAGAPAAAGQAPAGRGSTSSTWEGVVTGGYTGNQLSFVISADRSRVEDIVFQGHWDCADGIETTTSGPSGSFPVDQGRIEITSVDPPDGGATATRFVLTGQLSADRAQGTLRINLNALGCDTRVLSWSATPVAG